MQPLPSQAAMLTLTAQHAGSRAMVIDAAWRTELPVDAGVLASAAADALAETEAAALGIVVDGEPRFVSAERAPVRVESFASERAYRAWRAAGTLPLDGGPLVRVAIVQVGGAHLVRVLAHHAVLDGYAVTRVFRRIVARLRAAQADGATLPVERLGDLTGLAAATAPARPPDTAFWSAATDGVGDPGREIAFVDRVAPPASHPVQHRARLTVPGIVDRREWPAEAVAVVAAYTARYLGAAEAHVGVTASLRRTALERATPVQWTAVVPTRLTVPRDATPAALAGEVRRWLTEAADRIAAGQRPENLITSVPAAWRTGRLYGPIVNVLPDVRTAGWSLDVAAWGPVADCLLSVYPEADADLVVDGVFHPALYDAAGAAAHVDAIAAFLRAALAAPDRPLPAVVARPVDPDRIAVPGGWAVPERMRSALVAAGFAADAVEVRTGPPVTVVLRGVDPARLAGARAVLPPGVRVRRA
ncbi:hypothetical protein [Tsukamurella paurometabola]|uniref:Dimodular nonribosomal peptide synthase n=1 Tax=Tsukamurella paurometabola TaxID=2061 RepID=A0A3P8MCJ7_TSUPA|nr:hypothetical protein [Tsukamurella paurometabola]UEA83524.1 hypothetical protein LK411_01355 [Tsukamurella paurometabola]VDR40650.1 Dimodular nonribosomal peptide synthase [Tsukamurella paurometabola]